ncbi:hypothetical protein BT69DRAFT_1301288 [Atractiella rhizophila]|nr:hypothetical protein BT69DRAFT_1301288 [Atractiella rhizophila]
MSELSGDEENLESATTFSTPTPSFYRSPIDELATYHVRDQWTEEDEGGTHNPLLAEESGKIALWMNELFATQPASAIAQHYVIRPTSLDVNASAAKVVDACLLVPLAQVDLRAEMCGKY